MQCSRSQHPSSLPFEGARRAWVSAPPTLWCHALVATGVVRPQKSPSPARVLGLYHVSPSSPCRLACPRCLTPRRGNLDPLAPARARRQDFPSPARAWAINRLPVARAPHVAWLLAALKPLVLPTEDLSWVFVLSPRDCSLSIAAAHVRCGR